MDVLRGYYAQQNKSGEDKNHVISLTQINEQTKEKQVKGYREPPDETKSAQPLISFLTSL